MKYTVDCAEELFEEWEQVLETDIEEDAVSMGERMLKLGFHATIWDGEAKYWADGSYVPHFGETASPMEREWLAGFGSVIVNVCHSLNENFTVGFIAKEL